MMLLFDLIAVLILLIAAVLVLSAYTILRPPRMTDGKAVYLLKRLSPADMGMEFENLRFTVRDQRSGKPLDLAAWWIPNPGGGDKTVILIHGYADAKVGSIAWAPVWRELGYHILAIDLRAHGESGGVYCTAGVFERHDLDQVINQLRTERPLQTQQLVLFGISLGALVALATAAMRDDIAAVVLECPIVRFARGIEVQANLLGMPLVSMLPLIMRVASWICGGDIQQFDSPQLIEQAKCPIMVIQAGDDQFVSSDEAKQMEAVVARRGDASSHWLVEGAQHLLALSNDAALYRNRLGNFLTRAHGEVASRSNA